VTLSAVVGVLLSCEDSEVIVPPDGIITMSASPGTVRIDPNTDEPDPETLRFEADTTVTAFVFNEDNLPQQGVTINFQSNSELPLDPAVVETDNNGRAVTTLTVTDLDGPNVEVQGRSGSVTGTVVVQVDVVGLNALPRATVTIVPLTEGQVAHVVTFDGSGSIDLDSNITCYQWELLSDNPDDPLGPNPSIVQGVGASGFQRTFANEQTLSVTLRVSGRTDIACQDHDGALGGTIEEENVFSPLAARSQYPIVCSNPAPTALIAGPDPILATGTTSTLTSITLDGSLSSDGETRIDRYVWNCGNEFAPINVAPDGSVVICRYRLGTYNATLNVTDQGTGVINPNTGNFDCQKASAADTVSVIIASP
jgi:hypothetical protein